MQFLSDAYNEQIGLMAMMGNGQMDEVKKSISNFNSEN